MPNVKKPNDVIKNLNVFNYDVLYFENGYQ